MIEKIMDIFERAFPYMSRDDRNILYGFAIAQERKYLKDEKEDKTTS